jgi:hypothetical protein
MNLRKVLFIGGNPWTMPSVRIRCVDIALHLGCQHRLMVNSVDEIPNHYSAFVCVKPNFGTLNLGKLAQRGAVVWDIIDRPPPIKEIAIYLASTNTTQRHYQSLGRVELIPHHHCNKTSMPILPKSRKLGWIGHRHWCPNDLGIEYNRYYVEDMTQQDVVKAHQKFGVGLNLRGLDKKSDFHIWINSGIKLINCIGFGLPSVSGDEPAYREFGGGCTIISSMQECAKQVHLLQSNDALYAEMRQNCIRVAPQFNIETIAEKYRMMLGSL